MIKTVEPLGAVRNDWAEIIQTQLSSNSLFFAIMGVAQKLAVRKDYVLLCHLCMTE